VPREDALREARERHLLARAAGERRRRFGRDRVGAACTNALLVLFRRTKPAGARQCHGLRQRGASQEIVLHEASVGITTSPSTDSDPAVSPDGARMLFYRDNDLYVMKARAEGQTNRPARLTRSRSFEGAPDWSPDGAQITFMSDPSGNYDAYRMKAG